MENIMDTTTERRNRFTLELDPAAIDALDRARAQDRLSRTNFARLTIVRALRETGHLPANTKRTAR